MNNLKEDSERPVPEKTPFKDSNFFKTLQEVVDGKRSDKPTFIKWEDQPGEKEPIYITPSDKKGAALKERRIRTYKKETTTSRKRAPPQTRRKVESPTDDVNKP